MKSTNLARWGALAALATGALWVAGGLLHLAYPHQARLPSVAVVCSVRVTDLLVLWEGVLDSATPMVPAKIRMKT